MSEVLVDVFAGLTPAAAVCGAVGVWASCSSLLYLTYDAEWADFDPRPAVRDALECGRLKPVWQAVVDAGHTANRGISLAELHALQARDRARLTLVAALLVAATHLSPSASKKGTTHV